MCCAVVCPLKRAPLSASALCVRSVERCIKIPALTPRAVQLVSLRVFDSDASLTSHSYLQLFNHIHSAKRCKVVVWISEAEAHQRLD